MARAYFYLVAASWLLTTTSAFAFIERRVERRFEVPVDAVLSVDSFSGMVRITEEANSEVIEVVVLQRAEVETESQMDARLALLTLDMSQKNGAVSLVARYRKPVVWSWTSWPPVNLSYEIKVPRRCDVQVTTREGSIVIGSLEGRVVLANESGNIFTGEIDGSLTVHSNTGELGITAVTGSVTASTATGSITVGRAGGPARLSSQGGYMELQRARGEVVIRGSGSDAKVGFAPPVRHPADIELSGGELILVVESTSVCTLDLRTSVFGKVGLRGELPRTLLAGGEGQSNMEAMVNGGGPRITARAKGGNIMVRGVEPLPVVLADENGSENAGTR
ncbi:MAG: hypothetical protein K0R17_1765 [Rariglobus sp.]|jgi:hypothetical protein|nr:hypothetical protein [Rariglobus sp.]